MTVFFYDMTFEGLLTALFDAYFRKTFPDLLLAEGEPLPLFYDDALHVCTDKEKSSRVWKGLEKRLSATSLSMITYCWLSELPTVAGLLFRYMRKVIDSPQSIEQNFGDPDVLEVSHIAKKVSSERTHVLEFLRFQKAADGTYFAPVEPLYNVISLIIPYLKDRFADQKWLFYDLKRGYGYYYDLQNVSQVTFPNDQTQRLSASLSDDLLDKDEKLFQQLWKEYFNTIAIKARINPRLQRQNMPMRFWKYMTEKQ